MRPSSLRLTVHLAMSMLAGLSGGVLAQSSWRPLASGTLPPARWLTGMAWDVLRSRCVVFGGATGYPATVLGDTWEWDGTVWLQRQPATSPSPRFGHAMVYDFFRQRTVLFGGATVADTWEWDGTNWQLIATPVSPPARSQFSMVYDFRRQRTVVFGSSSNTNDLWEYDGTTWTKANPPVSPSGRCCAAMSFDMVRGVCLLFGGYGGTLLADTWEWNGTAWTQRFPVHIPAPRCCNSMAHDWGVGRTVMFGGGIGVSQPDTNEVWEWNGEDWLERKPASPPQPRRAFAIAFDLARSQILVLGGGVGQSGNPKLGDFWAYASGVGARYTTFGAGCAGSAGVPRLAPAPGSLPWLGESLTLRLESLPAAPASTPFLFLGGSKTSWGALPLPLALDAIGMTGCSVLVAGDVALTLGNVAGSASWSTPIPNDPSLVGRAVYFQGGVLDPAANRFGATLSEGGEAVAAVR